MYSEGMILGIDEAGRGPWAGPLVVGAVVLGGVMVEGLTDSKKLTKKKREVIYDEVIGKALAYASGWVSAAELDAVGMGEALRIATRRAVEQIKAPYSEIIIDGTVNFLKGTGKGEYVQTMAKADLLVPSVSAASIIAKVERDRYMAELDRVYSGYGFKSHAGYGVAKHRLAIEQLGVTPEHRLSFAPLAEYRAVSSPSSFAETASRRALLSYASGETRRVANVSEKEMPSGLSSDAATTKAIGDKGETVVAEYLQNNDHTILDRNWRTKFCEIDIVSQQGDTIYFVEVKYRKNDNAGDGLAAITPRKLKQMTFAAGVYAQKYRLYQKNLRLAAADVTGVPPTLRSFLEIG